MVKPDLCPTCGKALTRGSAGHKVCSLCGKRMGRFDKWRWGSDGRAMHKNCDKPTGIAPPQNPGLKFE